MISPGSPPSSHPERAQAMVPPRPASSLDKNMESSIIRAALGSRGSPSSSCSLAKEVLLSSLPSASSPSAFASSSLSASASPSPSPSSSACSFAASCSSSSDRAGGRSPGAQHRFQQRFPLSPVPACLVSPSPRDLHPINYFLTRTDSDEGSVRSQRGGGGGAHCRHVSSTPRVLKPPTPRNPVLRELGLLEGQAQGEEEEEPSVTGVVPGEADDEPPQDVLGRSHSDGGLEKRHARHTAQDGSRSDGGSSGDSTPSHGRNYVLSDARSLQGDDSLEIHPDLFRRSTSDSSGRSSCMVIQRRANPILLELERMGDEDSSSLLGEALKVRPRPRRASDGWRDMSGAPRGARASGELSRDEESEEEAGEEQEEDGAEEAPPVHQRSNTFHETLGRFHSAAVDGGQEDGNEYVDLCHPPTSQHSWFHMAAGHGPMSPFRGVGLKKHRKRASVGSPGEHMLFLKQVSLRGRRASSLSKGSWHGSLGDLQPAVRQEEGVGAPAPATQEEGRTEQMGGSSPVRGRSLRSRILKRGSRLGHCSPWDSPAGSLKETEAVGVAGTRNIEVQGVDPGPVEGFAAAKSQESFSAVLLQRLEMLNARNLLRRPRSAAGRTHSGAVQNSTSVLLPGPAGAGPRVGAEEEEGFGAMSRLGLEGVPAACGGLQNIAFGSPLGDWNRVHLEETEEGALQSPAPLSLNPCVGASHDDGRKRLEDGKIWSGSSGMENCLTPGDKGEFDVVEDSSEWGRRTSLEESVDTNLQPQGCSPAKGLLPGRLLFRMRSLQLA